MPLLSRASRHTQRQTCARAHTHTHTHSQLCTYMEYFCWTHAKETETEADRFIKSGITSISTNRMRKSPLAVDTLGGKKKKTIKTWQSTYLKPKIQAGSQTQTNHPSFVWRSRNDSSLPLASCMRFRELPEGWPKVPTAAPPRKGPQERRETTKPCG